MVNTMSTSHHDHSLRRGEHIIPADGTITLSGPFDTPMGVFNRYRQAYAACLVFRSVPKRYFAIRQCSLCLPGNGKSPCPILGLYDKCHNPRNGIYSFCCRYPTACKPRKNIVQPVRRTFHKYGRQAEHGHRSCIACSPSCVE